MPNHGKEENRSQNPILTPVSLWSDFDPSLPLGESVISEMRLNGCKISSVYFSGRETGGGRVRIFGTLYAPDDGAKHPAVLILPDPASPPDEELASELARRGYVALAIDLGGKSEEAHFTQYPPCVAYANYAERGNSYDRAEPTAKETCWYEWIAAARYAVSFLSALPVADGAGVLGVGDGGSVALALLGTDKRLRCGVSLFGAGWLAYRAKFKFSDEAEIALDDERYRFLAGVDAHAYAQFVSAPFLLLTSTNDRRSDFDRAYDTVSRVPAGVDRFFNCSVLYDGILGDTCMTDLFLFLERYLGGGDKPLPKSPSVELAVSGDRLVARVNADEEGLALVKVFFAEETADPARRSWREGTRIETEEGVRFEADFYSGSRTAYCFARAVYESGFAAASETVAKKIASGGRTSADRVLYSGREGQGSFTIDRPDPNELIGGVFFPEKEPVRVAKGPAGIAGIGSAGGLRTFRPGETRYRAGESSALKFDLYSPVGGAAEIVAFTAYPGTPREIYRAQVTAKGGEMWQNFMLAPADFRAEGNRSLGSFSEIVALSFRAKGEFLLNNLLWV